MYNNDLFRSYLTNKCQLLEIFVSFCLIFILHLQTRYTCLLKNIIILHSVKTSKIFFESLKSVDQCAQNCRLKIVFIYTLLDPPTARGTNLFRGLGSNPSAATKLIFWIIDITKMPPKKCQTWVQVLAAAKQLLPVEPDQ